MYRYNECSATTHRWWNDTHRFSSAAKASGREGNTVTHRNSSRNWIRQRMLCFGDCLWLTRATHTLHTHTHTQTDTHTYIQTDRQTYIHVCMSVAVCGDTAANHTTSIAIHNNFTIHSPTIRLIDFSQAELRSSPAKQVQCYNYKKSARMLWCQRYSKAQRASCLCVCVNST